MPPAVMPTALTLAPDDAVYLFALCRSGVSRDAMGMDGLSLGEGANASTDDFGEPVLLACTPEVWAVVSVVPRPTWAGDAAAGNMDSLAWVAPRATRHEEIVEAVMEAGPAYPARFGTLFSSGTRLAAVVQDHRDPVVRYLDRVEGAEEWAIKLLLDREKATREYVKRQRGPEGRGREHAVDEPGKTPESPASGTAYLQRKVRERDARADVDAWLDEVGEAVFDTLASLSRDAAVLAARDRPDEPREVAAHFAFLVPKATAETFFQAIDMAAKRLTGRGLDIDCTGPWPPYSFRPSLNDQEVAG